MFKKIREYFLGKDCLDCNHSKYWHSEQEGDGFCIGCNCDGYRDWPVHVMKTEFISKEEFIKRNQDMLEYRYINK